MDSENDESPPLLHMYVPPRKVYAVGVELDVPVFNYVGPARSMDAGDAEIRRLLDEL